MNLFGFGKKSEKRTPKVLGEHLAELFGAQEGEELIVEATESGLTAIDAAESRLAEFNVDVENLKKEKADADAAKEKAEQEKTAADQALKAEQDEHKKTSDEFEKFKSESGESHTTVHKTEDTVQTEGDDKPKSQIRTDEEKAREQGSKIFNSKQSKSK